MGPGGRERGLEFLLVSVKSGAAIIPTPTSSVLSSGAWVARAVPEVGVPAGVCLLSRASSHGTSVHTARSPWFARAVELPTLLFVGWRVWLILGVRVRHRPPPRAGVPRCQHLLLSALGPLWGSRQRPCLGGGLGRRLGERILSFPLLPSRMARGSCLD